MPLESAADFTSYVDTTAHGVTATLFEVQNSLFDSFGLIDSLFDIDSGNSTSINIIIDQEYLGIGGGSIEVDGFQPTAFLKASVNSPTVGISCSDNTALYSSLIISFSLDFVIFI